MAMSLVSMLVKVQHLLVWGEEFWMHLSVESGWVVFSPVVNQVGVVRMPEKLELILIDTVVL